MSDNPTVNRYLKDAWMDDIDHALGRPADPLRESYRNYYATQGDQADQLTASPHWRRGCSVPGGLTYFHVTDEGRKALGSHLKEIGDRTRIFYVELWGHTSAIAAKSRSAAKYSVFLGVKDIDSDLTFLSFLRQARVYSGTGRIGTRGETS